MACSYWSALIVHCFLMQRTASITVEEFYPFGWLAGDTALIQNDDGASPPIHLQTNFPFFDVNRKTLYISNNGLLSFDGPVTLFSSESFPIPASPFEPDLKNILIAPYWADVDTRTAGSGTVWYRQTTNSTLLRRARQEVIEIFLLYPEIDGETYNPTLLVIATWDQVGYYNRNFEKTNTFQCMMVTDGFVSYIFFLYAEGEIQWTTGDNADGVDGLGGIPAQVGLNAGDKVRFQSIPLSQKATIVSIDDVPGNTGKKGLWAFRVDSELITEGKCTTDGSIALLTNRGSILGGTATVVIGPCFNSTKEIFCDFDASIVEETVQAIFLDSRRVLCISPALSQIGRTKFQLIIGENFISKTIDYYSLPFTSYYTVGVIADSLLVAPGSDLTLNWSPDDIVPADSSTTFNVDIVLHLITSRGIKKTAILATNISNSGSVRTSIPLLNATDGFIPVIIQAALTDFHDNIILTPSLWSMVIYYGNTEPSRQFCIEWSYETVERDTESAAINLLINCPCNVQQAEAPNSGFKQQQSIYSGFQNPGAEVCFYQSTIKGTSARQCCYNGEGQLIRGPTSGGHSDFYSPISTPSSPYAALQQHVEKDLVPFIHCCKSAGSLCIAFYEHRTSAESNCNYVSQSSAFVYGDPHFVTFDGFKYTFNGKGDFVFIETDDNIFTMHGRMSEATNDDGILKPASVISAIGMKQEDSDTIQFEISRRVVDVLVNGIRINFNNLSEIPAKDAVVNKFDNGTYTVQFSCGVYIKVDGKSGYLSPIIVSLPEGLRYRTYGLLGSFNGNPLDDLLPRGDVTPLPTESSLQIVHEGFGLTWTIGSQNESIIYYRPYEDFAEFFNPGFAAEFEPSFMNQTLEMQALSLCNGDLFCIFDIAVTTSIELGLSTRVVGERVELLADLAIPIICEPACRNGTCVANNTCNCQAGYEGDKCEMIVLEDDCETDVCQNEGTCIHLAKDSICLCPPYSFGFNCEQLQATDDIFELTCTSELQEQYLQVVCSANLPILSTVCTLNDSFMGSCTLPFNLSLSSLEVGNNTIIVTATSVFNDTDTSMITRDVEPLDLQCKGDAVREHLIIDGCKSTNKLVSTTCSLNTIPWTNCDFPLDIDITLMLPGVYILEIAATDVFNNHDQYYLQYTRPSLDIRFVNNSPRVTGQTVIADFTINRPRDTVPVYCYLTHQPKTECSHGRVVFTNLVGGTYRLRIVAKASNGERDVERRNIYIGDSENSLCAVHLINDGVQVDGRNVTVQFVGTRAVDSLYCKVDGGTYTPCQSPYRLFNVEPGRHRVQVWPQCYTEESHKLSAQFNVEQ